MTRNGYVTDEAQLLHDIRGMLAELIAMLRGPTLTGHCPYCYRVADHPPGPGCFPD